MLAALQWLWSFSKHRGYHGHNCHWPQKSLISDRGKPNCCWAAPLCKQKGEGLCKCHLTVGKGQMQCHFVLAPDCTALRNITPKRYSQTDNDRFSRNTTLGLDHIYTGGNHEKAPSFIGVTLQHISVPWVNSWLNNLNSALHDTGTNPLTSAA